MRRVLVPTPAPARQVVLMLGVLNDRASVTVHRNALILLLHAQRRLWRHWVALGVSPWTGTPGPWALKLAPFLIPPFRVLILNENGDFFAGSPAGIARHAGQRLRDAS